MCPDEYRSVEAQRRITCQLFMQLNASNEVVSMERLDAEMDQLFPFVLALVDECEEMPEGREWQQHIASVALVAYRLTQRDVRERFIKAVHYGLFLTTNTNLTIEEEDLWTMSFAAVLKYAADPTHALIENPQKFLFKTAKRLFQSDIRRVNHERLIIEEAGFRIENRLRRKLWLRQRGIENLAAEVEEELPRFAADKLQRQMRSKRTRAIAKARVDGFVLVLEMLLQHPDRSLDACRIRVERIVERVNRSAPTTFALVPSRSTFFRWTGELLGRLRERADRRVVFPYTQSVSV